MRPGVAVLLAVMCLFESGLCQQGSLVPKIYQNALEFVYGSFTAVRRLFRTENYKARELQFQPAIPETTPFPCDRTHRRSAVRPTSVHRLRPGDIDVVGAMGDSLTAGFGANPLNEFYSLIADRDLSFSIGGAENWRTVFTLPNVLKLYNPELVGFSLGVGYSWNFPAQFNVAEGVALSRDLLHQAQVLTRRMRADTRVDFQNDWKMVTILIGNNDMCSTICYSDLDQVLSDHRNDLIAALDFLRDNVPRIFINLIAPPDVNRLLFNKYNLPESCYSVNRIECTCLLGQRFQEQQPLYDAIAREWQQIDEQVAARAEYANKADFAVVFQPFSLNSSFGFGPLGEDGRSTQEPGAFAPDCFHFSQKTHARAAQSLWNNLLQPVGSKSREWTVRPLEEFSCPNATHPFFYTAKNSVEGQGLN